jgi:hypothetical protein
MILRIARAAALRGITARLRRKPDAVPETGGGAFIAIALFAVAQVAVVAFSGSYQHQYELNIRYGQTHWVAGMQPLSVEGLVAAATMVIWYAARYGWPRPLGAYLVLGVGVAQTAITNLAADHRYHWPWLGPELSVWPAVAFVAAYEMAVWLVRKRQDAARRVTAATPADSGATMATGSDKVRAILSASPAMAKADVAASAGVSERTVERVKRELNGALNG